MRKRTDLIKIVEENQKKFLGAFDVLIGVISKQDKEIDRAMAIFDSILKSKEYGRLESSNIFKEIDSFLIDNNEDK